MGIVGGALGFYVQGTTTTRRRLDSLMSLTSAKTITPISYHRPSKYKEPRAYYYYYYYSTICEEKRRARRLYSTAHSLFSHLDGREEAMGGRI